MKHREIDTILRQVMDTRDMLMRAKTYANGMSLAHALDDCFGLLLQAIKQEKKKMQQAEERIHASPTQTTPATYSYAKARLNEIVKLREHLAQLEGRLARIRSDVVRHIIDPT
jgi:hypothetical protein